MSFKSGLKNGMHITKASYVKRCERFNIFINGTNITNHKYALKGVIGPTPQETIHIVAGLKFMFLKS